jgi:hypothetical protein
VSTAVVFNSARTQIIPALVVDDLLVSHMRVANKLCGVIGNAVHVQGIYVARVVLFRRTKFL